MAKVQYEPFCMQGSLLKELSSPLFNGVKRERRVGLEATRLAEEVIAKATQTPKLALFLWALSARLVTGKALLVQIFMNVLLSQRDPIREEVVLSLYMWFEPEVISGICISYLSSTLSLKYKEIWH